MPLILPNTIANEQDADGDKLQQNFAAIQMWGNQDAVTADGSTAMVAPLLLPGPPTQPDQAATKGYVDGVGARGLVMLPGTTGPISGGAIPNPLTGFMFAGGTVVGAVNAAYAYDITLPGTGFPNGLLSFVAMAGDHLSYNFICVGYGGQSNKSKLVLALYQHDGNPVGPGSVVRVNYMAIGY